jgi:hypothetical protein
MLEQARETRKNLGFFFSPVINWNLETKVKLCYFDLIDRSLLDLLSFFASRCEFVKELEIGYEKVF